MNRYFLTFFVFFLGFFTFTSVASAATWQTSVVSLTGDGSLTMSPGEVASVEVRFANNSGESWDNDGVGAITAYTYDPKYRKSDFDPGTWVWGDKPAMMRESSLVPGEVGSMQFELRAPLEVGRYTEVFQLAADDTAWLEGGRVTFSIHVTEEVQDEPTDAAPKAEPEIIAASANELSLEAGELTVLQLAVKNAGSEDWSGLTLQDMSGDAFLSSSASVPDLAPGAVAPVQIIIEAPDIDGATELRLGFANGANQVGEVYTMPVTVSGGSKAPSEVDSEPAIELPNDPFVRVGLITVDEETDDEVIITSVYSDFRIESLSGVLLAEVDMNETARAWFDGSYWFEVDDIVTKSDEPIRFIPTEDFAPMRIANFDRRVTRTGAYADNEWRHILEMRHNTAEDRIWIINELPVELYLRGLAETSQGSPMEYQKAIVTAARTFVMYHKNRGYKWHDEYFDLSAYSWDQVYLGYGKEKRAPDIRQAAEETEGILVTYNGDAVLTPYFARSNGTTRPWSAVYNGDAPWVKVTSVPCDAGRSQFGHGVGMSASGAICMARGGDSYDDILHYFFDGIELNAHWKSQY
jgi:hypothetical protein